jgi:putative tryptophan/tyrosine transport system substrate-binding protein
MLIYQQIVTNTDTKTEALWLPQDSTTVQDSVVLPLVLRSAWSNNLTVFSSTLGHVRQGALFSLFPDLLEYGRRLGQMALQTNMLPGVYPVKELQAAINVSTASHLRLNLSNTQLQEYQMNFPEQ